MIHEQDTADQGCPLNEAKKGNSRVGTDQTEKKNYHLLSRPNDGETSKTATSP